MSAFRRRPVATAIIALFSAASAARAETVAEKTLPEINVQGSPDRSFRTEATTSATRTETPLRDIPQFVNEIPQSVIRTQGAVSLTDALRNAPGISYAAAEGGTQANQVFYLRGFPLNQDVYIDGIRDMGEYNRDLFATETVEVIKGPSALLFGRGGSGGLINQTSKLPDLQTRKEVSFTAGSFDQKRLTGDLNIRTGESSAFRVVALAEHAGSYRYPQDVERLGIAPSFWTQLGDRTELTLSWYYLKTRDVTDYGQPTLTSNPTGVGNAANASQTAGQAQMPPFDATRYFGLANHDYAQHETSIATAQLSHRFNDLVSLKNTFRIANYRRQMEATIATLRNTDANGAPVTPATPLALLMVTRNHDTGRTRDNDDDTLINQTDLTWKFATGDTRHTLLTGFEFARERLNRWNYTLDADPLTAGVQTPSSATPYLNPDPSVSLAYSKTLNLRALSGGDTHALYAQDQIEFSREWKALLGLRWEQFSADARTITIATGATAAGPFARTDRMLSGRAGLIWQPGAAQSYYLSFANSYNPSGELGVYAGTAQTNLNVVNQTLDPEENRNYEIGAQWDFARGLQLRSALFRTEKINQRINNSITGITELAGKRRVEGLEMQVSGALAPNWDLYAGAALMNGKIVKATVNEGRKPLGVPDAAGNLWTVYRLGDGWEIGGGVNLNSGFWLTDANNGKVPAYAVFDATAAYVRKNYELRLNLYNVADRTYYLGGYNNSPNRVLPGVPRSIALTLRYSFD